MTTQVVVRTIPTLAVVRDTAVRVVAQPAAPTTMVDNPTTTVVVDSATQRLIQTGQQGPRGPQGVPGPAGGATLTRTASVALGGHRVVRSLDASQVGYADTTNPLHGDDTLGLSTGAAVAGAELQVQNMGSLQFAGWTWTPGQPVFLGQDGLLTQTPLEPVDGAAFVQAVGHAEAADTLYIDIQPAVYFED